MPRYKLTLEYDGSPYYGWQFQKNQTTVMGVLSDAIKKVFETSKFEIYGSGRTDAGVHALGQVAHLDVQTRLNPETIKIKLNENLPATVNVKNITTVNSNFHARYDAVARSYIYHIAARRTAFGKKYAYWVRDKLNTEAMNIAAVLFTGMHDFRSFGSAEEEGQSTKVQIIQLRVVQYESSIYIHIVGSHFLWKMVRRIAGVIIECGRNKLTKSDIQRFLDNYSDIPAKLTVPPAGLFLEKVFYTEVPNSYEPVLPMIIGL